MALLQKGLSRAKPWQRQLAALLIEVDARVQVLRLTVAMERSDAEIVAAAEQLGDLCRLAAAAVRGSRVDPTTRAAIQLIGDMAVRIRAGLESMQ
ncbi:MAG: hypothetical protein KKD97_00365 [Gammaproteobacteria bacterium]|nr:hypothetical protein [Gammaproteobacteria bacterium]